MEELEGEARSSRKTEQELPLDGKSRSDEDSKHSRRGEQEKGESRSSRRGQQEQEHPLDGRSRRSEEAPAAAPAELRASTLREQELGEGRSSRRGEQEHPLDGRS